MLELHHRLADAERVRPRRPPASAKLPSATTFTKAFMASSLSIDGF